MSLRMASPTHRKGSSFKQSRNRVPVDLRSRAPGAQFVLNFPAMNGDAAETVHVTVGKFEVSISVRTRDPVVGKARKTIANAVVQGLWARLRSNTPTTLSTRDAAAVSGGLYNDIVTALQDNPEVARGMFYHAPDPSLSIATPTPPADVVYAPHDANVGAFTDAMIAKHSLVSVETGSRTKLDKAVASALAAAGETLRRNASGDWNTGEVAKRFPPIEALQSPAVAPKTATIGPHKAAKGPSWEALISLWERNHVTLGGAAPTRKEVRAVMLRFAKWVKKPPADVAFHDVQNWRDKLLADGLAPSTVNTRHVGYIRAMYRLAREERLLTENPAADVRVRQPRIKSRMAGFDDATAHAILQAAQNETMPYRRWVPWLMACTGSRVSAVMNLRACDVKEIDGLWCIEITREASKAVKTDASCRVVPLHPTLIEQGFVKFAQCVGGESPLFYQHRASRRGVAEHNPGKARCNHLRNWVHSLSLPGVGRDEGRSPNHAWRHRLKTQLRGVGASDTINDAITGHEGRTDGDRYGTVKPAAMYDALIKLRLV